MYYSIMLFSKQASINFFKQRYVVGLYLEEGICLLRGGNSDEFFFKGLIRSTARVVIFRFHTFLAEILGLRTAIYW